LKAGTLVPAVVAGGLSLSHLGAQRPGLHEVTIKPIRLELA
jgi:hypothetical protein